MSDFKKELTELINRHSKENASDTPDFILAEYLNGCLESFDKAVSARTKWYPPASKPRDASPTLKQNEYVDLFDIGTSRGTEKDIISSQRNNDLDAFLCDHANEVPGKCSYAGECYCKRNTCKAEMKGPYSEIKYSFSKICSRCHSALPACRCIPNEIDKVLQFRCTCLGDGPDGSHSIGCFDDQRNHCPSCNSFLYTPDWKTRIECPDTFGKCKLKKQYPKEIDIDFNDD